MLYKKLTLVIVVALFTMSSAAEDISDLLKPLGFVERGIPVGDDWASANQARDEYIIEKTDGLHIRKRSKDDHRIETVVEIGGVKYIGVDRGEWGGGLFVETQGTSGRRQLMEGNVKALIPVGESLYVFEGLAHGVGDRGSVSIIRNSSSPSTPERVTLLPGSPEVVMLEESPVRGLCFTIFGFDYFARLKGEDSLEVISVGNFWGSLYPTSVVKLNDCYIVGIRSGIAVVELSGFPLSQFVRLRYFVPKK
jgi:hypothetical protein